MKPMLMKAAAPHPLYYYRSGMRMEGPHPELLGNVTDLRGNVTGLRGDLDACGITDAEREAGVDVATLVRSEP